MRIPDDHTMCGLCREVVPTSTTKDYVKSVSWGSFSGTPTYGKCCAECWATKTDDKGYVKGQAYA